MSTWWDTVSPKLLFVSRRPPGQWWNGSPRATPHHLILGGGFCDHSAHSIMPSGSGHVVSVTTRPTASCLQALAMWFLWPLGPQHHAFRLWPCGFCDHSAHSIMPSGSGHVDTPTRWCINLWSSSYVVQQSAQLERGATVCTVRTWSKSAQLERGASLHS